MGKATLAMAKEFVCGKHALYFTTLEQSDHNTLADFTRKLIRFFDPHTRPSSFSDWVETLKSFIRPPTVTTGTPSVTRPYPIMSPLAQRTPAPKDEP